MFYSFDGAIGSKKKECYRQTLWCDRLFQLESVFQETTFVSETRKQTLKADNDEYDKFDKRWIFEKGGQL